VWQRGVEIFHTPGSAAQPRSIAAAHPVGGHCPQYALRRVGGCLDRHRCVCRGCHRCCLAVEASASGGTSERLDHRPARSIRHEGTRQDSGLRCGWVRLENVPKSGTCSAGRPCRRHRSDHRTWRQVHLGELHEGVRCHDVARSRRVGGFVHRQARLYPPPGIRWPNHSGLGGDPSGYLVRRGLAGIAGRRSYARGTHRVGGGAPRGVEGQVLRALAFDDHAVGIPYAGMSQGAVTPGPTPGSLLLGRCMPAARA